MVVGNDQKRVAADAQLRKQIEDSLDLTLVSRSHVVDGHQDLASGRALEKASHGEDIRLTVLRDPSYIEIKHVSIQTPCLVPPATQTRKAESLEAFQCITFIQNRGPVPA